MIQVHQTIGELPAGYAEIPIAFEVRTRLEPTLPEGGMGGIVLREVDVEEPYTKNYDELPGGSPEKWADRSVISKWCFFTAENSGPLVGGVAVEVGSPAIGAPEGRQDVAVVWDIRVCPECRGSGIGSRLFEAAAEWARGRGCVHLQAETQNVNVPACRFYEKMGCELGGIDRFAYWAVPEVRGEIMMVWVLAL